ncbi:sigma-54-dependent transcriptional regulator [Geosporobacter ferrireducens]|uniref:Stage 0 sporulation protein A homolog n=1 Tax=Geosporobacter ferrireducens TaxID=1424294 RepID=A0A1D8GDR6_9FIRM|nr:response regulator [Geosporobacter ferrireducens]AOT69046.1 histidine kinase [Geosporobacter ferrireducens]MTI56714.1 response regulator [Geosporobacter ferrireducens]
MDKKILVVDDEKNIRMTLTHCLRDQVCKIDIAVNGEEALQKLMSADYDLVLLDIKMPGLTGMQVLEKMREKGSRVDVIMMTAYGTIERAVEAMKLGAIDFISKPFTPEEIRNIVKEVLDRQTLKEDKLESFKDIIGFAKKCIIEGSYGKAEGFLKKAIAMEVDAPEPHNLLGILAEYGKEIQKAQMHYRAALALDPSYEPASKNLERTAQWKYTQRGMELGDDKNDN